MIATEKKPSRPTANTTSQHAVILAHFDGLTQSSDNQWQAVCPAHDDKVSSLSVSFGEDGKLLLHCHANCRFEDIIKAAGLTPTDIPPKNGEKKKGNGKTKAADPNTIDLLKAYAEHLNPAPDNHGYLSRKSIKSHGLFIANHDHNGKAFKSRDLVVFLRDQKGIIQSYQHISPDGFKGTMTGGSVKELHFRIGPEHRKGTPVVISESYSTGATCYEAYFEALRVPVFVTCGVNNLPEIAEQLHQQFPTDDLVIIGDDDWEKRGNPGARTTRDIVFQHSGAAIFPKFSGKRTPGSDTDFNDLAIKEGLEVVRKQLSRWENYLNRKLSKSTRLDKEGNAIEVITKSIHNITVYLKTDPVYQAFIGFDAFQQKTYVLTQPPWDRRHRWEPRPWEDHDDLALAATLQASWMNVSPTMACDAVELVAHANTYHPLKDYLESLQWDGAPRLDAWVIDYLGAEDSDYTRAVSAKWLISAVARVYQPGCKADHALILESQQQGIGKSTALRVLAGDEYFSDSTLDIGNKDAMQRLAGVWIVEMAELEAFNRKESEQIKAFISSTTDKYRPAYGRRTMSVPRQCVFAGTVNDAAYLKDHTGNRRFWAVKCHQQADIAALEAQRDQIWAEAVYRFKADEAWHLTDPAVIDEAIKQQASREVPLLWEENIRLYLGTRVNVSIEEILDECLKIEVAQRRQPDYNAVSKVLQKLCWVRYNARVPVTPANLNGRQWRYRPATPPQGKKDKQTGTTQQEQHQEQNHRRESERQADGSSGFQYGSSVGTSQNPHGSYVGSTGSSGSSISIEEATLVDTRDTGIGSESKKGCGIDPYIEKSGSNLSHWNQPSKNAGSSDFDTGTTQPQTGTTPHSFNDSPSCTTCARYAPRARTCGAGLGYVADVERPPCGGAQFEAVFDKRQEKKND